MNETPDTAAPAKAPPRPKRDREGLLETAAKAAVFGVVGWGTYRLLDYLFERPAKPIVLVLEEPSCEVIEVDE